MYTKTISKPAFLSKKFRKYHLRITGFSNVQLNSLNYYEIEYFLENLSLQNVNLHIPLRIFPKQVDT